MVNRIVVGTQWGDEGKAKIVDVLAKQADIIIRYSGGANAGHTVVVGGETFILHLIPSGILYPDKICVLGSGTVIDPIAFLKEVKSLENRNISTQNRILVSDRAHVVLSYHKLLDKLEEDAKGNSSIGTTLKGIGPAYTDKIARRGIRTIDLLNKDRFKDLFMANVNRIKEKWNVEGNNAISEETMNQYLEVAGEFEKYVTDVTHFVNKEQKKNKSLLFESAQGTFLDIDHGTYPYVTSSNPISSNACISTGFSPRKIDEVIGVVKAYTTRVGKGPFPTELTGKQEELLREEGSEYGATTGRPRRCGWLDMVMVKRAANINGLTSLAVTKLDVLTPFPHIKICTNYEYDNTIIEGYPADNAILNSCKPVYQEMEGWDENIENTSTYENLPDTTNEYLNEIVNECEVPISLVSVGKNREQTIVV